MAGSHRICAAVSLPRPRRRERARASEPAAPVGDRRGRPGRARGRAPGNRCRLERPCAGPGGARHHFRARGATGPGVVRAGDRRKLCRLHRGRSCGVRAAGRACGKPRRRGDSRKGLQGVRCDDHPPVERLCLQRYQADVLYGGRSHRSDQRLWRSKAAGERALAETIDRYYVVRTSWVCGAHGGNFVRTMLRLGAEQDLVRVVDDQWGCPTFARDVAEAIVAIAGRAQAGRGPTSGIYHYCGAGETTWLGFAREIFRQAGPRFATRPRTAAIRSEEFPTAARRPGRSVLDCGRIETEFDVVRRPWREGLARLFDELSHQA